MLIRLGSRTVPAVGLELRLATELIRDRADGYVPLIERHLGPGDPSVLSDAGWRQALRASAHQARFGGEMILGEDLLQIPCEGASPAAS